MEATNFLTKSNDSENASFVPIATTNQIIPPAALYTQNANNPPSFTGDPSMMDMFPINTNFGQYHPQITTTPVVKSHHPNLSVFTPPSIHNNTNNSMIYQNHQQQQNNFTPVDIPTSNLMNNMNAMEIDDYFTPPTMDNHMFANAMQNMYSPSTSVTTNNSSIMMMDAMSPTSPTHNMMSPTSHGTMMSTEYTNTQPMDTFVPSHYHHQQLMMAQNVNGAIDNNMFPETPIVPTNIGMHPNYSAQNVIQYDDAVYHQPMPHVDRKNRRPLPRRHTVSTPYATTNTMNTIKGKEPTTSAMDVSESMGPMTTATAAATAINSVPSNPAVPQAAIKSRKSSLKAKRHRSLGKLDIYGATSPPPMPDITTFDPLSAKLELWTHEQLLERVIELEKEKEVAQISSSKQKDTPATNISRKTSVVTAKVKSAPQTDTELDEEEEEEEELQVCKWDTCTRELSSLEELINHVKIDHIGSGKANYYCLWKDCGRNNKPFTKRHKMHNHLRTHTGERPFVCQEPDCGKKFSRPDSLTTHAKIHSNIRPYTCSSPDCGKSYYHLRSLRKHERSHLQVKEGSVPKSPKSPSSSPPPPLPVSMMAVAHTTSQPDDLMVPPNNQVFSDWGLSAQAAVFNVMERENTYI